MKNNRGFTLLEVLIALAILSISLTAIIKSTAQNIKDTFYLRQKTLAIWVGKEVINETRVGILKLPTAPDSLDQETEILGEALLWKANLTGTPNPRIHEIDVSVFRKGEEEELIRLKSYLYVQ